MFVTGILLLTLAALGTVAFVAALYRQDVRVYDQHLQARRDTVEREVR